MPSDAFALPVAVVRVFCDDHDDHGNPLGIVVEGAGRLSSAARQAVAFELGFSETVFVDDVASGTLQIFTPTHELPLAGHPLVGTAWLLAQRGEAIQTLRPPAGSVACGALPDAAWIQADPAWSPAWHLEQLADAREVDAIDAAARPPGRADYVWAWLDEPAGAIRARSFAKGLGVVEDEATGSAALVLGGRLGRAITIRQGRGSVIAVRPATGGHVRVTGRVVNDGAISVDI